MMGFSSVCYSLGSHRIRRLKRGQRVSDTMLQAKLQELLRKGPVDAEIFAPRCEDVISAQTARRQ